MIFRVPSKIDFPGHPSKVTCDPDEISAALRRGGVARQGTVRVARLNNLVIRGSYETSKKAEVIVLIKVGGVLRFNAQDAVDEGILTASEVAALGYDVVDPAKPDEPVEPVSPKVLEEEVEKIPPPLPDFDVMSKAALVKWADDQDPPIHLDRNMRKDKLVEHLRLELATRKE